MAGLLRVLALGACAIVALGFTMFAADEAARGSAAQQSKVADELGTAAPEAATERLREREHGDVREAIDDANDVLLAPFAGLVTSENAWLERGVPTLLALLVYGVGLLTLANFLPKPRARGGDWRAAT